MSWIVPREFEGGGGSRRCPRLQKGYFVILLLLKVAANVTMSRQKLAFVMEISGLHSKDILKWKIMPKLGTLTDVFLSDYMGLRILCVIFILTWFR